MNTPLAVDSIRRLPLGTFLDARTPARIVAECLGYDALVAFTQYGDDTEAGHVLLVHHGEHWYALDFAPDQESGKTWTDPEYRPTIAVRAFHFPFAGPCPTIFDLADEILADNEDRGRLTDWREGHLLHLLFATADDSIRDRLNAYLGLRAPGVIRRLERLVTFLTNSRADIQAAAHRTLLDAAASHRPDLDPSLLDDAIRSQVDAEVLLAEPADRWQRVVEDFLASGGLGEAVQNWQDTHMIVY